ncbi:unnamed protein product [Cochlearia groenlandica]
MKKHQFLKNPITFLLLLITASSLTIISISFLRLPEPPLSAAVDNRDDFSDEIGFFGNMLIDMLPTDLTFTAFVPSEKAFLRDLKLNPNNTHDGDNTYAVVSRIMGFAVVPYKVEESDIEIYKTASYESLSGFELKIWRKRNGGGNRGIVVNGAVTEKMGIKRGKIIVHIIDGVVMDSDFALSFASSEEENN